ncbi:MULTISPECIES: ABC transporter ATP-binding protein [unclassified Undibacterium]|uniref:ABC transporter ATP-binding protein n=1 Tax=unclassified Undibacterium TaxID=2630295 RepID=UPI002AC9A2B2|nr:MULTISPECIES: ABC transporter ATP-binding protein [unclassified Undibacterium]MEB0138303.1 ABC transporter ATP-binding protein [Undibacterium sp. CCC2.1]MEB0170789.1 ABC transporter ATP-binding protein [Undibacterium sp. CCC1.1]MEB0174678.1 ABC transporter ATP-binding protein [Undibacterium sp. CCC3.4]MEB0213875.1 ABC transporter ATP-binding protein [Undibacterium sp. 5I2]WPX42601.1 ABC transporter ATP-binding protein [Undibacterium sp. CCC3.4]
MVTLLKVVELQTQFNTPAGTGIAVNQVSFSLDAGKILGIVGESGSGKSVLAYSLLNLVDPPGKVSGGRIEFKGELLSHTSEKRWNAVRGDRISMIFQDPMMCLNPIMKIGEQLVETLRIHKKISRSEAEKIACHSLERVGIAACAARMHSYPHELSGGMRQRIAIANAIINQPDLIIADEPTTALDVTIQAQILYEMKALIKTNNMAMLWITHDISVVKDLADELCVMYAGCIIEQGPTEQVIRDPRHPYTKGLIDALPQRSKRGSRLHAIAGSTPSLFNLPSGCVFKQRCERRSTQCDTRPDASRFESRMFHCFHPLEKK